MHNRIKDHEVKCLPAEGLISVNGLAEFLGFRNDKLAEKLNKRGIKTLDLSKYARFRLVNLSDLKAT
jgi:hypothetical protein